MRMSDSTTKLLNEIFVRSQLHFLSDLHSPEYRGVVRLAVEQIDPAEYAADAWSGAADYILGLKKTFPSAEDAAAFLSASLQ